MSRGPKSNDRLLNLLYKKTVPEVKPRIPLVKRLLYEQDSDSPPPKSALDGLLEYSWRRKPMESAIDDVCKKLPDVKKSSVLKLSCKSAFVNRADLQNIYPTTAERQYQVQKPLEKGPNFYFIKARNPISLSFLASFYLVFPNFNQACVYFLETSGKQINGVDLDLQFVDVTENHLKRMASPYLETPKPIENFDSRSNYFGDLPIANIFGKSPLQSKAIGLLDDQTRDRSGFRNLDCDPIYDILGMYSGQSFRERSVIVRNLPFGVTGPGLESLLWDYEFENEDDPQASITNLHSDANTQSTLALMKFKDYKNAKRFVRNWHGRRWEKVSKRKEKALYEPILCEIAY